MKKICLLSIIFLCIALLQSCDRNFEEINSNPNQPEEVGADLLLPNIIRSTVNRIVSDADGHGGFVAQYIAAIRNTGSDQYIWSSFSGVWNNGYQNLRNVYDLEDIAIRNEQDNYRGIALVLKTLIFSRLTDSYGDIPYSDAIKGKTEANYTPKYDRQEDIYAGMLADLELANQLLSPANGIVMGDILYQGDVLKWKKFANSLRLRLLLRISEKKDVSNDIRSIFDNPGEFPVFESNNDHATLTYLNAPPNLFPFTNNRIGHHLDRRLSKTFGDFLNETNDPRLPVWFRPTNISMQNGNPEYQGVPNGQLTTLLGSTIDDSLSALGRIFYVELQVPVEAEGLVMTYSELMFIKAEAAFKGWIGGDPAEYYYEGIEASVNYYNNIDPQISISTSDAFYDQDGVRFDPSRGMEMIITQKWAAMFFNGVQGWLEWKRTGLPQFTPAIENGNNDRIPVRYQYPVQQQTLNFDAWKEAVDRQGPDNINTKIWWMP